MITVRQAEQELADYLVKYPELYEMQLSIDKGLARYTNPIDRCKYLTTLIGHYCIDLAVECKFLNHNLGKIKEKLT